MSKLSKISLNGTVYDIGGETEDIVHHIWTTESGEATEGDDLALGQAILDKLMSGKNVLLDIHTNDTPINIANYPHANFDGLYSYDSSYSTDGHYSSITYINNGRADVYKGSINSGATVSSEYTVLEITVANDIVSRVELRYSFSQMPLLPTNNVKSYEPTNDYHPATKKYVDDSIANIDSKIIGDTLPIGTILPYSSSTVPTGYLLCDGSLISRTEYSGLFNVIGTSYNLETDTDDTKFRLPNLKGRVPVGLDSEDTDFNTLGKTGGSKYMQKHTHNVTIPRQKGSPHFLQGVSSTDVYVYMSNGTYTTTETGTGDSGNLQPYIVTNYIIKASETTSIQAEVVDSLDGNSTTNAPSVHAVKSGIMESGSNDNGNYIKFYDGTMICYGDKYGTTTLVDYWSQFKRGQVSITFPQTFISTPSVNVGLKNAESLAQLSMAAEDTTTSGFTAKVFKPNAATNTGINLTYTAIGKWK